MGFHGRAAAHKPKITMHNANRLLEWSKAHRHWTLEQWKHVPGVMNQTSPSGFGGCQENATCLNV
jgi:hypothetical protein